MSDKKSQVFQNNPMSVLLNKCVDVSVSKIYFVVPLKGNFVRENSFLVSRPSLNWYLYGFYSVKSVVILVRTPQVHRRYFDNTVLTLVHSRSHYPLL